MEVSCFICASWKEELFKISDNQFLSSNGPFLNSFCEILEIDDSLSEDLKKASLCVNCILFLKKASHVVADYFEAQRNLQGVKQKLQEMVIKGQEAAFPIESRASTDLQSMVENCEHYKFRSKIILEMQKSQWSRTERNEELMGNSIAHCDEPEDFLLTPDVHMSEEDREIVINDHVKERPARSNNNLFDNIFNNLNAYSNVNDKDQTNMMENNENISDDEEDISNKDEDDSKENEGWSSDDADSEDDDVEIQDPVSKSPSKARNNEEIISSTTIINVDAQKRTNARRLKDSSKDSHTLPPKLGCPKNCPGEFRVLIMLKRHMRDEHGFKKLREKCLYCSAFQIDLAKHIKLTHKDLPVISSYIYQNLDSPGLASAAFDCMEMTKKLKITCTRHFCKFESSSLIEHFRHLKKDHGWNYIWPCVICKKLNLFQRYGSLKSHYLSCHKCSIKDGPSGSGNKESNKMKIATKKDKVVKITNGPVVEKGKVNLKTQVGNKEQVKSVNVKSRMTKMRNCKICGIEKRTYKLMRVHLLTHEEVGDDFLFPFPCDQCPMKFETEDKRDFHFGFKHQAPRDTDTFEIVSL